MNQWSDQRPCMSRRQWKSMYETSSWLPRKVIWTATFQLKTVTDCTNEKSRFEDVGETSLEKWTNQEIEFAWIEVF